MDEYNKLEQQREKQNELLAQACTARDENLQKLESTIDPSFTIFCVMRLVCPFVSVIHSAHHQIDVDNILPAALV